MGKRLRHPRSRRSFERRQGKRSPRKCVLIVCEGEKTEPKYFESLRRKLRLQSAEVRICGKECGSAPVSVVEFAMQEKDRRKREVKQGHAPVEYDSIWCVIDVEESGKNPSLLDALQRAKDNKVDVALSNPCFEFWILLHLRDGGKPYRNCKEVIHDLANALGRPYGKGDDIFEELFPYIQDAIRRATNLEQRQAYDRTKFPNPSTQVHHLVKFLLTWQQAEAR